MIDVNQFKNIGLKGFFELKIKFFDALFLAEDKSFSDGVVNEMNKIKWLSYYDAKVAMVDEPFEWSLFNNPIPDDILSQESIPNALHGNFGFCFLIKKFIGEII